MKFDDIIYALSNQGTRKIDPRMVMVSLLFYGSILINRYEYKKDIKHLSNIINFYGLMFGKSGASKTFILNQVEKICNLENYIEQMEIMYQFFIEQSGQTKPDKEILRYIPMSPTVSVSGSKEGLFETAKAIKETGFGSLNLVTDEIMDIVTSSNELLNTLKQAYDGSLKAKVIKGEKGDIRKYDVNNISVNFLGAGSNDFTDKDTRKTLQRLTKSGMYRRSIIIDSDMDIELSSEDDIVDLDPVRKHFKYVDTVNKDDYKRRVEEYKVLGVTEKIFDIDNDAREYIKELDKALVYRANKDKLNQWKQYDVGALNTIVNVAYIIAYLEGLKSVTLCHVKKAWEIFIQTRETTFETFDDVKPHKEIYDLLKKRPNLTQSDLIDLSSCDCIPKSKNVFKDVMLLVQELAYRNNEILKENKGIVTRYSIEDIPATNLNKLIISFEIDGKKEKSISFEQVNMSWDALDKVVTSYRRIEVDEFGDEIELGIDSYTLAHYEASTKTEPYGHRKADNFIQGQNMLGLDFDSGIDSIDDIKNKFSQFKYLLYTTKSHRTLKSNYKDRFRVLIPTKSMFYVNEHQHKMMYKNISDFFDINPDPAAFNVSRLFFTNKDAEIYKSDTEELFDVSSFIPDTIQSKKILNTLKSLTVSSTIAQDDDEIGKRIKGILKYYIAMTHPNSNLKDNIFKLYSFVKDLTGSKERAENVIWEFKTVLGFPDRFILEFLSHHK